MDYEITPEEVKMKLDEGEVFTLLDVREPREFEAASIAGAKLVPMGDVPSRASGTGSGKSDRSGLPSRRAFDECDRVAQAAGI